MFNEVQGVEGEDRQRVLIGDPDPLARQAIALAFNDSPGFVVIAATGDPREVTELARHYVPEIALIHAGATEFDGLGICRTIGASNATTKVLIMERNPSAEREVSALRAGASGVVSKDAGVEGIVEATRSVLAGKMPHSDDAMRLLLNRIRGLPESGIGIRPVRSPLTPREWEVLDLLTDKLTTAQIAADLHLSSDTVSSHVKNLMRKLEVHSRSAAVERGRLLRWPESIEASHPTRALSVHGTGRPEPGRRPG